MTTSLLCTASPSIASPDLPVTLPDMLAWRAARTPDCTAFSFLADGETLSDTVTFGELHARASALAAHLRSCTAPCDRVLLVYQPGIDYIVAVMGCLQAGRIAVPAYPPNPRRPGSRLAAIVHGCAPALTLADEATYQRLAGSEMPGPALPNLTSWSGPRDVASVYDALVDPPAPGDVALLQYTSGSTADPKGVVLTHANLAANVTAIREHFGLHEQSVGLSWLPPYHDMGLIGFILGAIGIGCHLVLMPPVAFVQRPLRWLRAIERFQVQITGAPNFGYEHCLRKITAADRDSLDLSSWRWALNGAEPVRPDTLRAFAEVFAGAGFRADALTPCYGLAEATLLVAGKPPGTPVVVTPLDEGALSRHEVQPLGDAAMPAAALVVSSGQAIDGTRLLIVDVERGTPLSETRVGEICIAGDGVTGGYWNAPEANRALFLEHDGVSYLRTGDLGFLRQGELYVTGRIKDLIIMRGRNHYPQDIEQTVVTAHDLLEPGAAAAFSVPVAGEEALVVVAEVTRRFREDAHDEVVAAMTRAITQQHELAVHAVALLAPGRLLRTSSGKVRRRACRQLWIDKTLPLAVERARPRHDRRTVSAAAAAAEPETRRTHGTADTLIAWLREYGATRINSRVIDERRTIPPYVVLDFGNKGLMGLQASRRYGGLELSHTDALRVMEQVAAIDLTLASFLGVHQGLGTRPIERFALPALQQELLPALATGREIAAFALTEPGAGSNPWALQTRAVAQPDGTWKLYGEKEWIGLGSWAGVITVFAQLRDLDDRPQGITAFVVRQGAPGLRHGPEALTMGMRGMVQNRLLLEGVTVTRADMLGAPGEGMTVAQDTMMYGRLGLGVMSLAAMKRSAQLMQQYASTRTVSTGRLLDNAVTLVRLNALTSAISATESLVYTVARWLDERVPVPPELFMAVKITAPELLGQTVDRLVQLLGGRGYVEPNLVPQMLRDARLIRIFEGPTETLAMALGTYVLREATALWPFLQAHTVRPMAHERLQQLVARCRARGGAPHPWQVYQLGDYAAHALMLATVPTGAPQSALEQSAQWLTRLLEEKEAALTASAFDTLAPATAYDLTTRIAHYAHSIGNVTQQLAGEEHTPDVLLRPNARAASAPVAVPVTVPVAGPIPAPAPPLLRGNSLQQELVRYLAGLLAVSPHDIDVDKPMVHYGLDSLRLVELQQHIEQTYGRTISAETFFDLLTPRGLTALLADAPAVRVSPAPPPAPAVPQVSTVDFSLFFFSDGGQEVRGNPYQLLLDAARYADRAGFKAVWVPERHFHQFGGLYPNPSVVASALSMITSSVRLRAGSVVLPLHHPARVAEEWAVVDNLSGGRVDLAFTQGWSVNDFALASDRYATRLDSMFESLRTFETLWRGGVGAFRNGAGETVELSVYPRPHHADRTVWLTCTRGRERFEKAGELGANVLTALLMQTTDELAAHIAAYRASRARHGHDPDTGVVTLMLHTYIGHDLARVRELVRTPLREYLLSSVQLWGLTEHALETLPAAERERVIDLALERYLRTSSLIGTVDSTFATAQALAGMGVNELACLIDFGIDDALTLEGLEGIAQLRDRFGDPAPAAVDAAPSIPFF